VGHDVGNSSGRCRLESRWQVRRIAVGRCIINADQAAKPSAIDADKANRAKPMSACTSPC
jgi:hypothetical protein